jgi:hypothetical protein
VSGAAKLEEDERLDPLTLEQTRELRAYLEYLNGDPRLVLEVSLERFRAVFPHGMNETGGLSARRVPREPYGNWEHVRICGPASRLGELLIRLREVVEA